MEFYVNKEKKRLEDVKHFKWMYASLSGVCVAFFLALLSSNVELSDFWSLFFSSLCFGILLPISTAFICGYIVCQDHGFDNEAILEILEKKLYLRIISFSQHLIVLAFILLLFHFSILLGIIMGVFVIISIFRVRRFLVLVKDWDKTLQRIKEEENNPGPY